MRSNNQGIFDAVNTSKKVPPINIMNTPVAIAPAFLGVVLGYMYSGFTWLGEADVVNGSGYIYFSSSIKKNAKLSSETMKQLWENTKSLLLDHKHRFCSYSP